MKSSDLYTEPLSSTPNPGPGTVWKIIWTTIKFIFTEKPGQIMFSGLILLMLWGYHGNLEILWKLWPSLANTCGDTGGGPEGKILPWIPWDREIISFLGGSFIVVLIPILIIKFYFKEPLSEYGLAFPEKGKRRLSWMIFFVFLIVLLPMFVVASKDSGMRSLYPLYRGFNEHTNGWTFLVYQLTYFPFFLVIEFIFRGYFLFGLANNGFNYKDKNGEMKVFYIGRYAILIGMLSYTAWHLGKPMAELWGTPIWGLAAGACTYAVRSIWPLLMVHWLLNVFLDYMIVYHPF